MNEDTNKIIRAYLAGQTTIEALVSTRVIMGRLKEGMALPAISFFTRGGSTNPHIPEMVSPSVQFDCWGASEEAAREVYRTLFDVLQGIQNVTVTVDALDYSIMSAIEEVQGQDMLDPDFQDYFKVVTFYSIMIRPVTV